MPPLHVAYPALLGLLLLLPLLALAANSRLRAASGKARGGVLLVRGALLALLVAALAQPVLGTAGHLPAVVFAVDVSSSMTPGQVSWARTWVANAIHQLPPGSTSEVVDFAEQAQVQPTTGAPTSEPATGATNLESALRLAGSLLSGSTNGPRSVVLLTDGWENAGHAGASDLLPAGVRVSYVVPPPDPGALRAVLRTLDVPPVVRVGDSLDVVAQVDSGGPTAGHFQLWLDGALVADQTAQLAAGPNRLSVSQPVAAEGFHRLRATLTAGGASELEAVTVAKPAGRVLIVENVAGTSDALMQVLAGSGLQVNRWGTAGVPPGSAALADFDAVVLADVPATSLTLDQQRTLQSFVQDRGKGLVVVGGPHAFGPGGYEGTTLDDVLPVSSRPPVEPQQGNVALFLVIDRSGSMDLQMAGGTKIAMAREAATGAAELLQSGDTLGVVAFDSTFDWLVPPTRLGGPQDVRQAQARIATLRASGGTEILPALQAAYEAAARTDAPLKHVILVTDGQSSDQGYEALFERMRSAHITLSTLAIGSDADRNLLANLARLGGGRSYFTERSSQIPQITTKETTIMTRNAIVEGRVGVMAADPSALLRDVAGTFPPLGGYVATTPRERAVAALETERGHPLLAHWQYGLGRVVAWTSQGQDGWAADWATWPDGARLWGQIVRWAIPSPADSALRATARVAPDGRHVTIQAQSVAEDGRFADLLDTRATVVGPNGTAREVALSPRAPGTYELTTAVEQPGVYRVLVAQRQGGQTVDQELTGFVVPDAAERHTLGVNRPLLDQLARRTGGREVRPIADLLPADRASAAAPQPLWPWLVGAALALLPVDVALRRRV